MIRIQLSDVRANFSHVVERVASGGERFEITRNGKRAAVLLGADDYDGLLETVSVLSGSDEVRELGEAAKEFDAGKNHSEDDVRAAMRKAGRL